jgi:hypothetical protein
MDEMSTHCFGSTKLHFHFITHDAPPHSLKNSYVSPKVETIKKEGIGVHSLVCNILGAEGHVGASRWGLGRVTSRSIIHMNMHKPNNKLVSAGLEHFWCTNKPRAYMDSQDSPQPRLKGNHHLPPYSILCASHKAYTQMSFFPRIPKKGVSKFPKLGLLQLWKPITFFANLWLKWGLKKICSHCQDPSNNMWCATYTQVK